MRKFATAAFAAMSLTFVAAPALAADAPKPAYSTADTTIGDLIDTPETRAALDKVFPGMAADPQVEQGRPFTLRMAQQFKPDVLTDAKLAELDAELAKIPAKK